jgi:coproporphyrinogen III oxidase-like Fe-S oxidoreductase
MNGTEQYSFDEFFGSTILLVEREAIRREWLALRPPYAINARRLPKPVWARHGYAEGGQQAWQKLKAEMDQIESNRPYCIYIHIPFCASKCSFCDCYAFRLGHHANRHIGSYCALLEQEMCLWSELGGLARRPVSTVHFGGGTPLFLGEAAFSMLVQKIRQYFNTGPQTEWALETTSSELSDGMFVLLESLGFTRLHLGVQSLDDPIRKMINRREPAKVVLGKLEKASAIGWVTSVDLIFGLPTQTLESLLKDIHQIAEAGGNGFSMYELQRSARNRTFIEEYDLAKRNRTLDYLLLQGASQRLSQLGYKKTLFNHFADEKDTDLYFTFPERGEDCLALGTIADGVFNGYHYRHPEYVPYCKSVTASFPGLEGGIRQSKQEGRLASLETAILSARLTKKLFVGVMGEVGTEALFGKWLQAALIAVDPDCAGQYCLTANGSWFAGEMMAQLGEY